MGEEPPGLGEKDHGHGTCGLQDHGPQGALLERHGPPPGGKDRRFPVHELSTRIEESGLEEFRKRGKIEIQPNVDFYSAPVYHMMGIPAIS